MKEQDEQGPQARASSDPAERRRHTRYRFAEAIVIRQANGTCTRATTSEISISGLSATTPLRLAVGEKVHLSPVAGATINAIVRRNSGTVYGFEFVDPPDKVVEGIYALCRGLFPFRGAKEYANQVPHRAALLSRLLAADSERSAFFH